MNLTTFIFLFCTVLSTTVLSSTLLSTTVSPVSNVSNGKTLRAESVREKKKRRQGEPVTPPNPKNLNAEIAKNETKILSDFPNFEMEYPQGNAPYSHSFFQNPERRRIQPIRTNGQFTGNSHPSDTKREFTFGKIPKNSGFVAGYTASVANHQPPFGRRTEGGHDQSARGFIGRPVVANSDRSKPMASPPFQSGFSPFRIPSSESSFGYGNPSFNKNHALDNSNLNLKSDFPTQRFGRESAINYEYGSTVYPLDGNHMSTSNFVQYGNGQIPLANTQFSHYPNQNNLNRGYGYSYIAYIERQSRRFPVMIYTLVQCVPCNRAKHLLATTYPDVASHYLELVGHEDWQRQLQVDLLALTRQDTFPYIFVCGEFIGGSSNLFDMHKSGQLRTVLSNCQPRV